MEREGFTVTDKPTVTTPKFGDVLDNPHASDRNPTKRGVFVRQFKRTGKMNPGTIWEFTDGKGNFWEINKEVFQ